MNTPVRVFGRNLLIPHPTEEDALERVYVLFDGELADILGVETSAQRITVDRNDRERRPIHETSADRLDLGAGAKRRRARTRDGQGCAITGAPSPRPRRTCASGCSSRRRDQRPSRR